MFSLYSPPLLSSAEQEVGGTNPDRDNITASLPWNEKRSWRLIATVQSTNTRKGNCLAHCLSTCPISFTSLLHALFVNLSDTSLLPAYSNFVLINTITQRNTFSTFYYIPGLSLASLSVSATALSYKQQDDHQMIECIQHRHKWDSEKKLYTNQTPQCPTAEQLAASSTLN